MSNSDIKPEEKFAFGLRLRRIIEEHNENAKKHGQSKLKDKDLASACKMGDPSTIGRWKRGEVMPTSKERRVRLSKFFGRKDDYFEDNKEKMYSELSYDRRLLQMYIDEELQPKIVDYDLDLNFLRALHDVFNMDEDYTPWTPIVPNIGLDHCNRFELADYQDTPKVKQDYLQLHKSGKCLTLMPDDVVFLKELQEDVKGFIKYKFERRKEELQARLHDANCDFYREYTKKTKHTDKDINETIRKVLANDPGYKALQKIDTYIDHKIVNLSGVKSMPPEEFKKKWNEINNKERGEDNGLHSTKSHK